jgi:hypothetical protein
MIEWENLKKTNQPFSEEIHNTILSLPCAFFHTEEDIIKVIETMNKFPSYGF